MLAYRRALGLGVVGALSATLLVVGEAPARAVDCPPPASIIIGSFVSKNLSGCNLAGSLLTGDLSTTNFSGANLSGAGFLSATLNDVNFTGANLSNATFGNVLGPAGVVIPMNAATLTNANLTGVTWTLVRGRNLVGTPAALGPDMRIIDGTLFGPRVDLSATDLSTRSLVGLNLSEARLSSANLSGTNLTSANLASADLTQANLTGAQLGFANLRGAQLHSTTVSAAHFVTSDLSGVRSSGIVGAPADLPSAWRITIGRVLGRGIDMREENLAGANLRGLSMVGFDLTKTNLTGATLDDANLTAAKLSGATLDRAHGFDASFFLADLTGASLKGAILRDSNLQKAKLHGASFDGSNLVATDFRQAQLAGPSVVVDCVPNVIDGLIREGVGRCTARSIPVSARPASLRNTRLTGAQFPSVNLLRVDLSGSDLQGTNFTGANLARANLSGARLDRTVLTGATLTRARATGLTGTTGALPTKTVLANGVIAGPGLDLSGLDLRFLRPILLAGAVPPLSLAGANLVRADVGNLPLGRTSLSGATTAVVIGTPASLPSGWRKRGTALLGPGVDLSFSEDNPNPTLEELNTRGISLQGAKLRNLFIPGHRLERPFAIDSRLGGATSLRGADFTGSIIDIGITPDIVLQGRTDLRDARLVRVRFTANSIIDSTICNADLRGATLFGSSLGYLVDSDVEGANLNGGILGAARLSGTPQQLRPDDIIRRGYLIGPGHDVGGADLSGMDLHGRNLTGLKMTYKRYQTTACGQPEFDGKRPTKLSGTNLSGANLTNLRVDGFSMFAPGERSQLALDARDANFNGATLTNARLAANHGGEGFDFFIAYSDGATFRGISARGATLALGGRVDLTNANLRAATVSVSGHVLQPVTLTGAVFDSDTAITDLGSRGQGEVISGQIRGTTTNLPSGWRLSGGRLLKD